MEKYHGCDQQFYDFLFGYVIEKGGTRMQILAADLGIYLTSHSQ